MCGINLILDKKNRLDEKAILAMNQAIVYRGPDATNYKKISFRQGSIYLGANRLAITDPNSTVHQPISSADNKHHLCFNGEIYNHQDLRKITTHKFRSNTDTESLLAAIEANGLQVLSKANGMYSFIYVDSEKERISFGKDPHGIKPLYYFDNDDFLIVSSEIKGILASGLVEKKLNAEVLQHYLHFRYAPPPSTFYKNIFEVKPGQFIIWTENQITKHPINYLGGNTFANEEEVVNQTKKILQESIQRQIPKDTAAGLFLSGGTDSTLLLAILRELGLKNLPLFTIGNNLNSKHHGSQDFAFALKAAKNYNFDINPIEISEQILQTFPEYVASIDQPIADNAGWLTWILSGKSVQYAKVVFSGAGADELFAGYNRHQAFEKYLKIMPYNIPGLQKLAIFPEAASIPFSNTFRQINKIAASVDTTPEKTWTNFIKLGSFNDAILKNSANAKNPIQFNSKTDFLKQALSHDLFNYLPNDVLKITDNSSMAWGQEIRVPFLDLEISHFASSIPADVLLKNGKKWILKSILKQLQGNQFATRTKAGFGMPLNLWLQNKQGQQLLNYIRDRSNPIFQYLDFNQVNQLIEKHLSNKKDLAAELNALIVLAAWVKKEFA